jgi:hypothetical protein
MKPLLHVVHKKNLTYTVTYLRKEIIIFLDWIDHLHPATLISIMVKWIVDTAI